MTITRFDMDASDANEARFYAQIGLKVYLLKVIQLIQCYKQVGKNFRERAIKMHI